LRSAYSYKQDPAVPSFADDHPILIYDGICAMCSAWVQFVLRHDKAGRFRFLAAQSALGRSLYIHYGMDRWRLAFFRCRGATGFMNTSRPTDFAGSAGARLAC
jgi:predicted DCC family thiol-disulfide oxidoreductase YuxK